MINLGRLQTDQTFNGWTIVGSISVTPSSVRYLVTCKDCNRHFNMEETSILMPLFDGCSCCLYKESKKRFKAIFGQRLALNRL